MRILLAHNNFLVRGGAEVFYHEVGRVLSAKGHEVAYFSAFDEGTDSAWKGYFPQAANYSIGGLVRRALEIPKSIYNRGAKDEMARLISDFQPDIVHAFATYVRLTPSILEAAREMEVPVVLSCNDYKHICPNYKLYHHGSICEDCKGGKFYNVLRNRCCHNSLAVSAVSMLEAYIHDYIDIWRKNVDCFLFASEFMANTTKAFWGEEAVNIDYLRNPFDAAAHHVDLNVGDYILYFGRLIEEKGLDVLLDAAALAPEVPIVVVGDGPDLFKLQSKAASLPNVRIVGAAWGDELAKWLKEARAVVVPSLWHENFPYVILQAFAAAKPVIGSNRGGIPELVGAGRHGWVYEAMDASGLATTLRKVKELGDDEVSRIGKEVQAYVACEFNDEKFYQRLQNIYRAVVK